MVHLVCYHDTDDWHLYYAVVVDLIRGKRVGISHKFPQDDIQRPTTFVFVSVDTTSSL